MYLDWKTATITHGAAIVNSSAIDFDEYCDEMLVIAPALDGAGTTLAVQVSHDGTTYVGLDIIDPGDGSGAAIAIPESTAAVVKLGGAEYVRFVASVAQTATDSTIRVKGKKG